MRAVRSAHRQKVMELPSGPEELKIATVDTPDPLESHSRGSQKLTVLDEGLRAREPPVDSCHVQGALPILTLPGMKHSTAVACEGL